MFYHLGDKSYIHTANVEGEFYIFIRTHSRVLIGRVLVFRASFLKAFELADLLKFTCFGSEALFLF